MDSINTRRFPRFVVKVLMDQEEDSTFQFILDTNDSEAYLFDYSTNFSEGGLFIKTNKVLPLDSPVHLRFYLPNSERLIEATGKVAWINSEENSSVIQGIGIRFHKLSPESLDIIKDFIQGSLSNRESQTEPDKKDR